MCIYLAPMNCRQSALYAKQRHDVQVDCRGLLIYFPTYCLEYAGLLANSMLRWNGLPLIDDGSSRTTVMDCHLRWIARVD